MHDDLFQLTRSRGAWLTQLLSSIIRDNFNSHAHVERDQLIKTYFAYCINFNSHAHVERDYRFSTLALYHANFNSHAHVERDANLRKSLSIRAYFNSHAHVERDIHAPHYQEYFV